MKYTKQIVCAILTVLSVSCSERIPNVVQEMNSTMTREDQIRIFDRIATNAQERKELFTYINAHPSAIAAAKTNAQAFYADSMFKASLRPTTLELQESSEPLTTYTGLNYAFSSPWPGLAEWKHGEEWIAFQDLDGHTIMLSTTSETNILDDFMLRYLSSTTNDSRNWIWSFAFPDPSDSQGASFYRQCLHVTPQDLNQCDTIEDVYRHLARMVIKLIVLTGLESPIVDEIHTGAWEGFQVRDAKKPGRYHLQIIDDFGTMLDLVLGSTKDYNTTISQADVNCVLLSLKRTQNKSPQRDAHTARP